MPCLELCLKLSNGQAVKINLSWVLPTGGGIQLMTTYIYIYIYIYI